jgi:hypothetical protein
MRQKECGRSRCSVGATVGKLALMMLMVLPAASLAPGAPNKDKDQNEESTQIYQHTYDEVFQAAQDSIERLGCAVKNADKDKGIITGDGVCATGPGGHTHKVAFDMLIETVSPKPETRVTINVTSISIFKPDKKSLQMKFTNDMFSELHKVLATYH